jgi:hypothetical protein
MHSPMLAVISPPLILKVIPQKQSTKINIKHTAFPLIFAVSLSGQPCRCPHFYRRHHTLDLEAWKDPSCQRQVDIPGAERSHRGECASLLDFVVDMAQTMKTHFPKLTKKWPMMIMILWSRHQGKQNSYRGWMDAFMCGLDICSSSDYFTSLIIFWIRIKRRILRVLFPSRGCHTPLFSALPSASQIRPWDILHTPSWSFYIGKCDF